MILIVLTGLILAAGCFEEDADLIEGAQEKNWIIYRATINGSKQIEKRK